MYELIKHADFGKNRLRGFGVAMGQYLAFPLTCFFAFATLSHYRASVWCEYLRIVFKFLGGEFCSPVPWLNHRILKSRVRLCFSVLLQVSAYCYNGECGTHQSQCQLWWGTDADDCAITGCYGLNTLSSIAGCGYNFSTGSHISCASGYIRSALRSLYNNISLNWVAVSNIFCIVVSQPAMVVAVAVHFSVQSLTVRTTEMKMKQHSFKTC